MEKREHIPVFDADPEQGLTSLQVEQRIEAGWISGVVKPAGKRAWEILASHTFTYFNLIFAVLAAMLFIGRSTVLNMGFLLVAIINTLIGIFQELRAKRAVEKLTLVARRLVTVIRDGQRRVIPPESIVRDDIAEFSQGSQICADGILRSGGLWVDESLISGESDAVEKRPGDKVRSGSSVLAGRGRVQLTAVGADSFAAGLAREAKGNPRAKKSEMMRSLDVLVRVIGVALIPLGLLLFYQEFFVLKLGLRSAVEGTVAALVGMIPEGLYLLTSLALAASSIRLSRKKVLVQDLSCIESLARVDVLCVDKTGTITEQDLEVEQLIPLSGHTLEQLQEILTALYGSIPPDNATGKAIASQFSGESGWVCEKRVPFSPEYRWSGAVFEERGAFLVGAPEAILGKNYETLLPQVKTHLEQGFRVLLAAAYDGEPTPGGLSGSAVTPLALILLSSRIRENAPETFRFFEEQGVRVCVLTGDDPQTASLAAARAGIPGAERYVDASELDTDSDFKRAARDETVFGRMTPDKKRRLIAAMQARGHTVAMAGDGVNDLLALRQADCSVAMGSGTEAASHMASLVLLKSDFSALPGIVAEGRRVINNIQRTAALFLVKNIFSVSLAVITLFTGWAYPLQPMHLTLVGALTIGIPSFFLAMEPGKERVRGHFLWNVFFRALPGGMTNVFAVLACQLFMDLFSLPQQTMTTVCTAILAEVGLLVLYQVCKPFGLFRKIVWGTMTAAVILSFTLLGRFLALQLPDVKGAIALAAVLLMTPTVFLLLQRIFNALEAFFAKFRKKEKK